MNSKFSKIFQASVVTLSASLLYLGTFGTTINNNVLADDLENSTATGDEIEDVDYTYQSDLPIAGVSAALYDYIGENIVSVNESSIDVVGSEEDNDNSEDEEASDDEDPASINGEVESEYIEYDSPVTYYTTDVLRVRSTPTTDDDENIIDKLSYNTEIQIIGEVRDSDWYYFYDDNDMAFVNKNYLSTEKQTIIEENTYNDSWDGKVLDAYTGTIAGPSGKETYYNLNMSGVIKIMRRKGFSEDEYPYWIRSDGVKMLGNYVMVAADLNVRPRGSLVETSLGTGLVCDTGDFIYTNKYQLDIAVSW